MCSPFTGCAADAFSIGCSQLKKSRLWRRRIELAFKRLKSVIGLKAPPGFDERSARPYVLAHLLIILVLEPLVSEFEDSPRLDAAA